MATIRKRGKSFSVIYGCKDEKGNRKQKWESFPTKAKALLRKKEIEYKTELSGTLVIPRCTNLRELLKEYVELYGKEKWALSTFERNGSLISNYIDPIIGDTKLSDISIRFLEAYYQRLLKTPAVPNKARRKNTSGYAGTSTVRDIHKLLRSCFEQAVKWELMERNPAEKATVPKHKSEKREIWTAQTLLYATEACEDADLKVAINLAFSASLRIGELAALTWDCVDISPEAIENGTANIYINKEYQRVSKKAIEQLDGKDILLVFPSQNALSSTVRVLKTPKTESSIRRIYIPKSVAQMLAAHKKKQDELKEMIGSAYHDYNLVMATSYGMPTGGTSLRKRFKKLIQENDLPEVVFHSLRHSSVTYKLKLNGGDVKSVQGDSGHAQANMVTEVYSHIIDEDRRKNAEKFEEAFYQKKNLNPQISACQDGTASPAALPINAITLPEGIDPEALARALANPEMKALLTSMAKAMQTIPH